MAAGWSVHINHVGNHNHAEGLNIDEVEAWLASNGPAPDPDECPLMGE